MTAFIIVDLGFGDAGKGLLTDYLCRHVETDLVVRYNGGAQAGHNVVTPEGKHHTFSQFGSGTFLPQVRTFLSEHVVIHPTALLVEGDILEEKGVHAPFSRLRISERALVITPFHQAANRIREMARGVDRHGSCGVGVGETVADSLVHTEASVRAGDLGYPDLLWQKLKSIRALKREQVAALYEANAYNPAIIQEYEIFANDEIIANWISATARIDALGLVVPDSTLAHWLQETPNVIFEGAQGILLDADAGFYPYVTWSRSTTKNAIEIIRKITPETPIKKIGVLRAYAVRHGMGPLPTETSTLNALLLEHNAQNRWQGAPRYGWFDAVLARYALAATGSVDTLAITHMDVLPRLRSWQYAAAYQDFSMPQPFHGPLNERAYFTEVLSKSIPLLENCPAKDEDVIDMIEGLLSQKISIVSYGPTAKDVRALN